MPIRGRTSAALRWLVAAAVPRPVVTAGAFCAFCALCAATIVAGCSVLPADRATAPRTDATLPEVASPPSAVPAVPRPSTARPRFTHHAVAAAHPLAADAGAEILDAGGSALDAAIAAQLVLALVEPQSSGLGGGAFVLHWDGREVAAWDGRETAPAAAGPDWFLRADGTPLPFTAAVASGRAVGVPGLVALLEAAHREYGRLPWARLFEPAIALAERGFPVGPRLHAQLRAELGGAGALARDLQARAYFLDAGGAPWPVGHRLRNPAFASVLRTLAQGGAAALHRGAIAADIVRRVNAHGPTPGRMTPEDLAAYRPLRRAALCTDWAPHWRVCGMPPPSSGHLALMQTLGLLERLDPAAVRPAAAIHDVDWLHRFTEAQRLAFADRDRHVADPDFVAAPAGRWDSLLDAAYLDRRAALVGANSLRRAPAGDPSGSATVATIAPMAAPRATPTVAPTVAATVAAGAPDGGTSHVSVVDREGRAVALSTSIESMFGARLMSDGGTGQPGGFLLNNQLTDFAFVPRDAAGRDLANRVAPGKRPRSSMSPTLVFDRRDGRLVMVTGAALGAHIIPAVARTLMGTLRWGAHPQDAVALPQVSALNGPTLLEAGRFDAALVQALRDRGHEVTELPLPTGLTALHWRDGAWHGAADPRREGAVRGR